MPYTLTCPKEGERFRLGSFTFVVDRVDFERKSFDATNDEKRFLSCMKVVDIPFDVCGQLEWIVGEIEF